MHFLSIFQKIETLFREVVYGGRGRGHREHTWAGEAREGLMMVAGFADMRVPCTMSACSNARANRGRRPGPERVVSSIQHIQNEGEIW